MEYKYICVYLHTCIYTHIIHTIHCWLFFKQTKVGKPNNSYKRHTRLELFLWKNHTHTNANLHSIELPIRHWFISHIYINKYDITYYIPYSIQSIPIHFCFLFGQRFFNRISQTWMTWMTFLWTKNYSKSHGLIYC